MACRSDHQLLSFPTDRFVRLMERSPPDCTIAFFPDAFSGSGFRAERWLSGRKRRIANLLYGLLPVPRVRIPASPPLFSPSGMIGFIAAEYDGLSTESRGDARARVMREQNRDANPGLGLGLGLGLTSRG